jgi:D-aminopeptidase
MEDPMNANTYWDSFKAESGNVLAKVKALIHEGNVRRVVIQHDGRNVAEFPLTAGVVGAVLAPVLAAIGALVALLQDCTIHVERETTDSAQDETTRPAAS